MSDSDAPEPQQSSGGPKKRPPWHPLYDPAVDGPNAPARPAEPEPEPEPQPERPAYTDWLDAPQRSADPEFSWAPDSDNDATVPPPPPPPRQAPPPRPEPQPQPQYASAPTRAPRKNGLILTVLAVVVVVGALAAIGAVVLLSGGSSDQAGAPPSSSPPARTTSVAPSPSAAAPPPATTPAPGSCESIREPNRVQGNGPGGTSSGPEAILAFEHAYYVTRSGVKAREVVAPNSTVNSAEYIQAGIDTTPPGTLHCVSITPAGDNRWSIDLTEWRPGQPKSVWKQTISTVTTDGRTLITAIAAG